ncbi:hypothetical protein C808_03504 [Lachnospiraceae bacterium M18-1]|nr:hypothetical protein C808_03504 [Lachnospiraceae bacterium M18-1]
MLNITHMTCEHQINPLAIENPNPRFSWEVHSEEPGVFQTACRITVSEKNGHTVWDSGRTETGNTLDMEYAGTDLKPAARYVYNIQVWDNRGNSCISEAQIFETAYLNKEGWNAKWIEPEPLPQLSENPLVKAQEMWMESLTSLMKGEQPLYHTDDQIWDTLPAEPYDPPVRFRRVFELGQKPEYAKIFITAHGIYGLSINGRKVPGTLLAPGFTTYDKCLKYQAYDVTEYLHAGKNALAVTVADGWYKGKIALGKGCEYGEIPGLLMQMELWNPDGTRGQICSDEAFTCSYDGPIRYADLFLGECVDARKYDGEPSEVSFRAENWKQVIFKEGPRKTAQKEAVKRGELQAEKENAVLMARSAPEIEVYEELPAKQILTAPNGETVVDFGQNMAGTIRVEISAKAGEEITFDHGEVLDQDGNFTYAFTGTTRAQRDVYISAGRPGEVFEPEFTYHGFRYVRVIGGKDWKPEQFTAKAVSSANPVTGSFRCSDEKLNRLQSNIYWSQRSNTVGTPTDCPTREKAGWTGDVVVYGATALYNQEMTSFFEDWLESIRMEQNPQGHVMNTVPLIKNYVQQTMAGSLGWGDVILTLPLQLYQLCGNRKVLEKNYGAMERWVQAMQKAAEELPPGAASLSGRRLENQHYLINTGFHFGDWLVPSVKNEAGFSDGPASAFLTMQTVDTTLLAADADMLSKVSELLGKTEKAEAYRRYAARVREAFYEELCDENGKLTQEMQGNYVLALKHHMVPEALEKKLAERLAEQIIQNENRPDTGFMSVAHILDVLCDYGYRGLAWKVLNQNGCPGWIYEVEHGATTMWENWDAVRPDGQVDGCSFNHYAFGCVGDFLYRRVLGIQNAGIGYDRIRFEPGYDFGLEWAEGSFHSVRGKIRLRWEKTEERILVSGTVPANTEAVLVMPDGTEKKLENGRFQITFDKIS